MSEESSAFHLSVERRVGRLLLLSFLLRINFASMPASRTLSLLSPSSNSSSELSTGGGGVGGGGAVA